MASRPIGQVKTSSIKPASLRAAWADHAWWSSLPEPSWPASGPKLFLAAIALLGAMATMSWLLLHQSPGTSAWLPPCLFHELTGLFSPGRGITRAAHALVHGQWARAWSMNWLALVGLAALSIELFDRIASQPAFWATARAWLPDARPWAVLVLVFVIGRNLPWPPFSGWAPI